MYYIDLSHTQGEGSMLFIVKDDISEPLEEGGPSFQYNNCEKPHIDSRSLSVEREGKERRMQNAAISEIHDQLRELQGIPAAAFITIKVQCGVIEINGHVECYTKKAAYVAYSIDGIVQHLAQNFAERYPKSSFLLSFETEMRIISYDGLPLQ